MARQVAVIGGGTWGTALSQVLADNGHGVRVWDLSADVLAKMRAERRHPKLPGVELPASVKFIDDFEQAVRGAQMIVVVVPSPAMRATFRRLHDLAGGGAMNRSIVVCTKGMDSERRQTFSQLAQEEFGQGVEEMYCALSGPTHAEEVGLRMPTAIVAASASEETAGLVQETFSTPYFRVYSQEDVIGVEIGAAVKNIVAIAAGAVEGLGFGDNTKAAILTRGLAEITRLGLAFGAAPQTFAGLAGIGDIIVTATSRHSRNRLFGELIAKGHGVEQAIKEIGMVVEGYNTVATVHDLSGELGVTMPITAAVYHALFEGGSPQEMVRELMTRPLKSEMEEV